MAITTFGTLKTALAEWGDQGTSISDAQLGEFVQFATIMFNFGIEEIPALRIREMEEIATITPTAGACTLPTDYQQYRRVTVPSAFRTPLTYITPETSDDLYDDRGSGTPIHFTIIGSSLYMFPLTTSNIELTYYKSIPALSADSDTNWLLTKHPSLYLHGSLFQLAMFRRNDALQARSAAMTLSLMSGLVRADMLGNYAYAPTTVSGMVIA